MYSDTEIVHELLHGNRRMVRWFYVTYATRLMRYVHTRIAPVADADEVVQDILYAFLESIRDFTGQSKLTTYLYGIARHKISDYYRKKKFVDIVFSKFPKLFELVSPLMTPEESWDSQENIVKIKQAFTKILPTYRALLRMKYIDGLAVREIAINLKTSLKSVEMSLMRARRAFVAAYIQT